ncbi:MAG: hypothetical protein WC728_11885 [Elusimicrobiota bacterium]
MTRGKALLFLLAGLGVIVVLLTVARVSKKRPAADAPAPAPSADKPYPVYATPEELMRDHERAFKFVFDVTRTLKAQLEDYYLCKAVRDRNPSHCDVVDVWNIAKFAPPLCRMHYYHAVMFKEIFTSEVPPPTCLSLTKMMNLMGAPAEEMCTNKDIQQAIRRGDVERFCGFLKSAGIAPPDRFAPCAEEYKYLTGKPEVCGGIEDPVVRSPCESRSFLLKALREGAPGAAADGPYAPLVGSSCQAVGRKVLETYENAAASFAAARKTENDQKEVARKVKAAQEEGARKRRQSEEEAKRANAEREERTREELRKMIESTKAAQAEKERKEKEEALQAALKQKQAEEERKAKLARELAEQKRKQDENEVKIFEDARRADAEKKNKTKKATAKPSPKPDEEEDTP